MERSKPHDRRQGDRREPDAAADTPVETLAADLPRALRSGEIGVLFQPQVRIADGRITGAEALARWEHPTAGPIGAELLFAVAERLDLDVALSTHVQQRALDMAAGWRGATAALDVSLNVTARDLALSDFADGLLSRVAASGLPLSRLTVEVTETAPIADLAAAARALAQVRGAGARIAIDDFGAGYASFAYVKALPLDRLKIDRSLVEDVDVSAKGLGVVRGAIALAQALDLDVLAEGVERAAQRDILAQHGCGWYQGFLCAGALDGAALARRVERDRC